MRRSLLPLVCLLTGCLFAHDDNDLETRPDIAVGTGATILWPGQPPPPLGAPAPPSASTTGTQSGAGNTGSGSGASSSGAPTQGTGSSSQSGSGAAAGGPEITMIGGTSGESSLETRERRVPIIGPLTTLIGYPFWINGHPQGFRGVGR